jgi:hypothetical protein
MDGERSTKLRQMALHAYNLTGDTALYDRASLPIEYTVRNGPSTILQGYIVEERMHENGVIGKLLIHGPIEVYNVS